MKCDLVFYVKHQNLQNYIHIAVIVTIHIKVKLIIITHKKMHIFQVFRQSSECKTSHNTNSLKPSYPLSLTETAYFNE